MQSGFIFHVKYLFEGVHQELPLKHLQQTQAQKTAFLVTLLQLLWSLSLHDICVTSLWGLNLLKEMNHLPTSIHMAWETRNLLTMALLATSQI